VPVFVYVLGIAPKLAIASSLGVVGATTLIGTVRHFRHGHVDLRIGILFALGSAAGAYAGSALAQLVDGRVQLLAFSAVMLVVAVLMLRTKRQEGRGRETSVDEPAERTLLQTIARAILPALAVGLLTGFVGVGGGFLVVPALVLTAGIPMRRAIGTSLMVITINSAVGFLGYLQQTSIVEAWRQTSVGTWELTPYLLLFTGIAIAGVLVGTRLAQLMQPESLRRAFGGFLVLVGLAMLIRSGMELL
jgi:uncharacterized membrane protein YfcA